MMDDEKTGNSLLDSLFDQEDDKEYEYPLVIDTSPMKKDPEKGDTEESLDKKNVRNNIYEALSMMKVSLLELGQLAGERENARLFEVQARMFETYLKGNQQLADIHASKEKPKKRISEEEDDMHVTNNVLVMSSDDVDKMIRNSVIDKEEDVQEADIVDDDDDIEF